MTTRQQTYAAAGELELKRLRELTGRIGSDPLLTQASTGNSSAKMDSTLWIKASGKWMTDAMRDDIFIPLNLTDVTECLRRGLDPAERFPAASLETAMHAALPHRIVLHVHSVDTIAWAVRKDALVQLQPRLEGLRWQWVPYLPSGLPLSREIERTLSTHPDTDLFVLGNHGLVLGGDDASKVESLLIDVRRRLAIPPRRAHPADYSVIAEICADSHWDMPDDDDVHALATDAISQAILAGGLLYPCQAIFFGAGTSGLFRSIPYSDRRDTQYSNRPFLLIEKCGVIVNRSARPAELAMISGLAQVVQRLSASAPVRYLTEDEVAGLSCQVAYRYRDLANGSQRDAAGSSRSC
jgi:rhamnose utilization protein RhaD (predicted bifunctional aldolase and dehydrogenase)